MAASHALLARPPFRLATLALPVLPFTAIGLLPWWCCLALGRLNEDARNVAALLVLLAAVLVSGPLLLGAAPDRLPASGTLFAQAAAVGLLPPSPRCCCFPVRAGWPHC